MTTKNYPSTVSRTLDPSQLGLATVIGQHDRRLSDADVNLIQDVQDLKRLSILNNQTPSGCLTLEPFQFRPFDERVFYIPAFDVLFRGEIIRVGGNDLTDPAMNRVEVDAPRAWVDGMFHEDARVFVVFLEMWLKALNPDTGEGYYADPTGALFFYPLGCVNSGNPTRFPDTALDPFQNSFTTLRLQTQWRLRVEPLPSLAYDFESKRYGLDPDDLTSSKLYGRGAIPAQDPVSDNPFLPLVDSTGEPCLWRAGTGDVSSGLGTVDGYTYATPVAVVFQRNKSPYSASGNPFGCAARASDTGTLASKTSGRPDNKFVDIIYPEDVVDTRLSVSLVGYELDLLAKQGISDVFSGAHISKISRGEAPGNKETALGSKLSYTLALSTTQQANVHTVGAFDGFANGFSSDSRTFFSTRVLNLDDRTTIGVNPDTNAPNSHAWGQGDVLPIVLDAQTVQQGAMITEVFVQSFYTGTAGELVPVALYGGQLRIDGLNTRQVTIRVTANLAKIALDLGKHPMLVTLGVRYPAGTGTDTQRVPIRLQGGTLVDSDLGLAFPVFGSSDYEVSAKVDPMTQAVSGIWAFNPLYSSLIFGTRLGIRIANSAAATSLGSTQVQLNTFSIPRMGMDSRFTGIYVLAAWNAADELLHISHREVIGDTMIVVVDGELDAAAETSFLVLSIGTAQAAFNPPVKGVTALEETVLLGNVLEDTLHRDVRFTVSGVRYNGTNTVISCYANTGKLKGFAGDDNTPLIWVQDTAGKFVAAEVAVEIFGAIATIVVNGANLENATWFMVASILPTPPASSNLTMMISYVPYQGEGTQDRDYTVVYAPEDAFVTTNGTGAAPVVGLQDVFPFDRQFPVAVTVPSLPSWSDADLKNQALSSELDGNFVAKRFNNVGHTFVTRLHTNDFIAPINGYMRKKIRLITKAGRRGYSKALPHIGFAISAPSPKSSLGNALQTTVAAMTLYVHNITGNNGNDGLSKVTAKRTLQAALQTLPPVLRHPISIVLVDTGYAYTIKDLGKADFTQALLGDGSTRSASYYCLGNLAFVMQESARITIGRETATGERITIDGGSFTGFGDGPAFAFVVSESRVIFHGLTFKGFTTAAVKSVDSDVELLDCELSENLIGVSAEQGSLVTLNKGLVSLSAENTGVVLASSSLIVSGTTLKIVAGGNPGAFFIAERGSNINLMEHNVNLDPTQESGILSSHVIALAQINSTITCEPTWVSEGKCKLVTNSTLVRSISRSPFKGGVIKDESSTDAPVL